MMPTRRAALSALTAALAAPLFLRRALAAVAGVVTGVVNAAKSSPPDKPGESAPVAVGDALETGAVIETTRQSAVQITMGDGSVVTVGARSNATLGGQGYDAMAFARGNFRWNTGSGEAVNSNLSPPALKIALRRAQLVVSVDETRTVCSVIQGSITCTSKKTGAAAQVAEGQTVLWTAGSFGGGATEGVFATGDVAVDQGIAAAAEAWKPGAPQ